MAAWETEKLFTLSCLGTWLSEHVRCRKLAKTWYMVQKEKNRLSSPSVTHTQHIIIIIFTCFAVRSKLSFDSFIGCSFVVI